MIGLFTGQNYPLRGGKCSAWEGGLRGTAFIHAPALLGKGSGHTATGLFHAVDWFPTILSLVARVRHLWQASL